MGEVTLSSEEFKALSSGTRTQILKLLKKRNHTLSELSQKLGLASPTVKQHMEVLSHSGLVDLLDEGRKWKYYSLTRKGKKIAYPQQMQTQFLIVLAIGTIGVVALLVLFASVLVPMPGAGPNIVPEQKALAVPADSQPAVVSTGISGGIAARDEREDLLRLQQCEEECQDCNPFEEECSLECRKCMKLN